jgi:hypothetical protein
MSIEDGDVRCETVIQVLQAHGVSVSRQKDSDMVIIAKGDVVDVRRLDSLVGRRMLHYLQRKFDIPIHHFYNPHMIIPSTTKLC